MLNLIKFSKDWADEFQAEGLAIFTPDETTQLKALVEAGEFEFYFGTNEGWDYGDIDLDDFTFTEISEEEAAFLKRLIPDLKNGSFGIMMDPSYVAEALSNTTE